MHSSPGLQTGGQSLPEKSSGLLTHVHTSPGIPTNEQGLTNQPLILWDVITLVKVIVKEEVPPNLNY